MLKKLIKTAAVTLGIAILAACSGEEPASETSTNREEPRRAAKVAAPEPTRPQRLDELLTPTVAPEAARATTTMEPGTKAEQREKKNGAERGSMPAPTLPITTPALSTREAPTIADLVPEDPETNDRLLLQDIYGQIDLEQFALDPNEPIPAVGSEQYRRISRGRQLVSRMNYEETRDHPYLHLFPHLKNVIENGDHSEEISYHPAMEDDGRLYKRWFNSEDRLRKIPSDTRSHLLYFIYNPWFDTILEEFHRVKSPGLKYRNAEKIIPYWFGNNSTRGILVETVAALLEEAKLPTSEPATRPWIPNKEDAPKDYRGNIITDTLTEREWTMEEYIRMPVYPRREKGDHILQSHQAPDVQWEILHPQLPILKITAHAGQNLPLKTPEGDIDGGGTAYSVSFVMSLQNRWTSFDEPDRWIVRFREELQTKFKSRTAFSGRSGYFPPHLLDPDLPYPNYWDDTDYMQHRIIGPVVLTVHGSHVLQPGTYSRVPRITHWETPGYILTDKQAKTSYSGGQKKIDIDPATGLPIMIQGVQSKIPKLVWEEKPQLAPSFHPHRYYYTRGFKNPNVGFPLPGHVMTTSATGPGTEVWREYKMNGWEEYDRSLGER